LGIESQNPHPVAKNATRVGHPVGNDDEDLDSAAGFERRCAAAVGGAVAGLGLSSGALAQMGSLVDLGARNLITTGTCDDVLAFVNPDSSLVMMIRNELSHPQRVDVQVKNQAAMVELPADSIATVAIEKPWISA